MEPPNNGFVLYKEPLLEYRVYPLSNEVPLNFHCILRDFGLGGKLGTLKQRIFPILVAHGHISNYNLSSRSTTLCIHMHMCFSGP